MSELIEIINLEFLSERKSISLIEPILNKIRLDFNIKDDKYYNILVAVTEAINNAIIHGNKLNPDKKVFFKIDNINNELIFTILDEGTGFNLDKIADPRNPENLMKDNGRGVFLIRELSKYVNFNLTNIGSKIEMHFDI